MRVIGSEERPRLRPRRLRNRRTVRIALVVLVALVAVPVGVYVGAHHVADKLHLAVRSEDPQVSAPSTPADSVAFVPSQPGERVAFDAVFTDVAVVRGVQDAVNALSLVDPTGSFHCPLAISKVLYAYTFVFSWHGHVVETADANTQGCGFWHISTLGIALDHNSPEAGGWRTMKRLTGMPVSSDLLSAVPGT